MRFLAVVCALACMALTPAAAARQTGKPAPLRRVTTDHLRIATYASRETVAPGEAFSIVFDINPRDRMHVYAPGANGYRVITVAWERNPAVAVQPLQYPESEIYVFAPLKERVPVFQKPFRLTQPLVVGAGPDQRKALTGAEAVTIKGTLEYQACDDRICFSPTSVPVSYTLRLRTDAAGAEGP